MLYVVHAVYGAAAAPATSLRPNLFLFLGELGAAVCCFNYNYKDLVPQPAHGEQLARLPVSGFPGAGLLYCHLLLRVCYRCRYRQCQYVLCILASCMCALYLYSVLPWAMELGLWIWKRSAIPSGPLIPLDLIMLSSGGVGVTSRELRMLVLQPQFRMAVKTGVLADLRAFGADIMAPFLGPSPGLIRAVAFRTYATVARVGVVVVPALVAWFAASF